MVHIAKLQTVLLHYMEEGNDSESFMELIKSKVEALGELEGLKDVPQWLYKLSIINPLIASYECRLKVHFSFRCHPTLIPPRHA